MNKHITICNKTVADMIVLFTNCSLHASDPSRPTWHIVSAQKESSFSFFKHDVSGNGMYVTALRDSDVVHVVAGKYDVFVPFGSRLVVEQHAA